MGGGLWGGGGGIQSGMKLHSIPHSVQATDGLALPAERHKPLSRQGRPGIGIQDDATQFGMASSPILIDPF